jgi:hypothetical protein
MPVCIQLRLHQIPVCAIMMNRCTRYLCVLITCVYVCELLCIQCRNQHKTKHRSVCRYYSCSWLNIWVCICTYTRKRIYRSTSAQDIIPEFICISYIPRKTHARCVQNNLKCPTASKLPTPMMRKIQKHITAGRL